MPADPLRETALTKRQIKRAYLRGEIGLPDAVPVLMFDHAMEYSEAMTYLMEAPRG